MTTPIETTLTDWREQIVAEISEAEGEVLTLREQLAAADAADRERKAVFEALEHRVSAAIGGSRSIASALAGRLAGERQASKLVAAPRARDMLAAATYRLSDMREALAQIDDAIASRPPKVVLPAPSAPKAPAALADADPGYETIAFGGRPRAPASLVAVA